jgi:hypothetical protein
MKNITITLDSDAAAWLRVHAAEQGKSVSRLVGEILHTRMRERREYQRALKRTLSKPPLELTGPTAKSTLREQTHAGPRLR